MSARGLKERLEVLGPAVIEDVVHRLTDPDGTLSDELLSAGWSRLELIELHAAATRGTLAELAMGGMLAIVAAGPVPTALELGTIEQITLRHVRDVMIACDGNKSEAARTLGIDRRSLYRWLERAGLHTVRPRQRKLEPRDRLAS